MSIHDKSNYDKSEADRIVREVENLSRDHMRLIAMNIVPFDSNLVTYYCDGCKTLKTTDTNHEVILDCISCDTTACTDCDEKIFSIFYVNEDGMGTDVVCDQCCS